MEVGRLLFGSAARYDVGVWIANRPGSAFYPSSIFEETNLGFSTSLTNHAIYDRFVELEMLQLRDTHRLNSRSVFYVRTDSLLWDIFRAAGRASDAARLEEVAAMKTRWVALREQIAAW